MASKQELEFFDSLLEKGFDANRAKGLVIKAREKNVFTDGGVVEEKVEVQESPQEVKVTEEIQIQDPTLDPKIAGSKARQQIAEADIVKLEGEQAPGFLEKSGKSLKEQFSPSGEGLAGEGIARAFEGLKTGGAGDKIKGTAQGVEGVFQTVGGTVGEIFNQAMLAAGEFGVKPVLESLDPDTLQTLKGIADVPTNFVGNIADSNAAESLGNLIDKVPENIRNDIQAGLNLIGFKVAKVKGKNVLSKTKKGLKDLPGTKGSRIEKLRLSKKKIRDNTRLLTGAANKVENTKLDNFGKLVSKNKGQLKNAKDFDDLAIRVENIGTRDINLLNKNLKAVEGTFKPQGAKEALLEMKRNVDKINFKTADKAKINNLLKKFDAKGGGLTLDELNDIKKSINVYSRGWAKSGLEGAGLRSESVRDKYTEVMRFIENTAERNGVKNVKELNNSWATSREFSDLLSNQASKAGKKALQDDLFKPSTFQTLTNKAKEINPFSGAETKIDKSITALEGKLDDFIDNIASSYDNSISLSSPGIIETLGTKKTK